MKLTRTWLSVVTVAVAVIATACGGSTGTTTNPADQTGTLTVWLMNGSAPQSVIDSVNADFSPRRHPLADGPRHPHGAGARSRRARTAAGRHGVSVWQWRGFLDPALHAVETTGHRY